MDSPHSFHFQHRIASGVSGEKHYGLVLARDFHLPQDLLQEADRMAKSLVHKARVAQEHSTGTLTASRRNAILQLQQHLLTVYSKPHHSASVLRHQLDTIQQAFMEQIDENLPDASDCQEAGESIVDINELLSDYQMREV